jgi:hypothetical protein
MFLVREMLELRGKGKESFEEKIKRQFVVS